MVVFSLLHTCFFVKHGPFGGRLYNVLLLTCYSQCYQFSNLKLLFTNTCLHILQIRVSTLSHLLQSENCSYGTIDADIQEIQELQISISCVVVAMVIPKHHLKMTLKRQNYIFPNLLIGRLRDIHADEDLNIHF